MQTIGGGEDPKRLKRMLTLRTKKSVRKVAYDSLGKIPSKRSILKSSIGQKIEKLCGQSEWQPRILYITADRLIIVHPDHDKEISDQIPLVSWIT